MSSWVTVIGSVLKLIKTRKAIQLCKSKSIQWYLTRAQARIVYKSPASGKIGKTIKKNVLYELTS